MFLTGRFIIPLLFTTHLAIPFPRIRIPCGVTHHLSQVGLGMQVAANFRNGNEPFCANCKAFTQELSSLLSCDMLLQCTCTTLASSQRVWLRLDLRARVA